MLYTHLLRAALAALLFTAGGCEQPRPATPPVDTLATGQYATATADVESETWDAYYINGKKAGFIHTITTRLDRDGRPLVRTEQVARIKVARSGQPFEADIRLVSVETSEGEVVEFEYFNPLGAVQGKATVEGGRLISVVQRDGQPVQSESEWPGGVRGFFAVEQSLAAKPMQPGERRTLTTLLPPFEAANQVGTAKLAAGSRESTKLLSGDFELLRVDESLVFPDGNAIESVAWVDASGEVLKLEQNGGQMTIYRTTKEVATRDDGQPLPDLGSGISVKLEGDLPQGHDTHRAVYEVALEGGDPGKLFPQSPTQTVEPLREHSAKLTVIALTPADKHPKPDQQATLTDEDRQPNSLVQSDDAGVAQLAESVAAGEQDPWKIALALEKLVHSYVTAKNYSQAFDSAATVVNTREGDCTEHAVLLAAMCRARQVPARVAMGLVYLDQGSGAGTFAYHMWNEVWIDGVWYPIDGTFGRGGIGAAHLKLAHSSLKGAAAYTSFLPILKVVGRLKIKVVEAE